MIFLLISCWLCYRNINSKIGKVTCSCFCYYCLIHSTNWLGNVHKHLLMDIFDNRLPKIPKNSTLLTLLQIAITLVRESKSTKIERQVSRQKFLKIVFWVTFQTIMTCQRNASYFSPSHSQFLTVMSCLYTKNFCRTMTSDRE